MTNTELLTRLADQLDRTAWHTGNDTTTKVAETLRSAADGDRVALTLSRQWVTRLGE